MRWIESILNLVNSISLYFYDAYQVVIDWAWPFYLLYWPLYLIHRAFGSLLYPLIDFNDWADDVWAKAQTILSEWDVLKLLSLPITWAMEAWDWVVDAWWNVIGIVGDWWESTKITVLGWIDIATEGFNTLLVWWDEFWKITWPRWTATLEVLGNEVSDFFTTTLPNLLDNLKLENWWNGKLFDVDGLIGSKLAEWFPFYDDIVEFINDPWEFLLSLLTDWFLGKEE